mgnify:FL=1
MHNLNVPHTDAKRVVIVGGGFAGLNLAKKLRKCSRYQVVLVDQNNYHLFKPLLYQVASAGLDPSDVSFPFRRVFRAKKNIFFRMGRMVAVHPEQNRLETSSGSIQYDYLVIATGCVPNFFGIKDIEKFSWPMADVRDSLRIRNTMFNNLERAMIAPTDADRQTLLNIVIVGGGASGVEIAGAMAEMRRYIVPKDYPGIDIAMMHIYLIEGRDRLLASMTPRTSKGCLQVLEEKGVEVLLGITVTDYRDNRVYCSDGRVIRSANLIWTSGVKSEMIEGIEQSQKEHRGRILTDSYNRVKGFDNIFAIGDVAFVDDPLYPAGYPQLARVAISQGQRLASNLIAQADNRPMKPYRYTPIGVLATVGRNRAFVEWGKLYLEGFWAWMVWSVIHILFLLGVQSKIKVFTGWIWNYFGKDLPVRLIIGDTPPHHLDKTKETDPNNASASH